jgi:hypothetical protein
VLSGGLLAALAAASLGEVVHHRSVVAAERLRLGERIYREGVLPSGKLLRGRHPGGGDVVGAEAACVQCHRASGMGTVEGTRIIPPIAGQFLYQPRAEALAELDAAHTRGPDLAHALGRNRTRPPYSDRTLANAIRNGIDSRGMGLEAWMPRYDLDASETALVVDYLKQLSSRWSPGVTRDTLHFATVVTPGVEPARRQAMLDVLSAFFASRNTGNQLERLREQEYLQSTQRSYRSWQLHVWELKGAPETWPAQLAAYERRQPVFALISGIAAGTWAPVHQFCETRHVPCWFPTVDLPVVAENDSYSIYFSKGVLLEADLLAQRLDQIGPSNLRRVIEIRGEDVAAAGAAQALKRVLSERGIPIQERVLRQVDAASLRAVTADALASDALVFWLRSSDVAKLAEVPTPGSEYAGAYFSATLAGGEHAPIPPRWKAQGQLIYPFELPQKRDFNMGRFRAWLKTRNVKLVDERVQADAYLASVLMSEKVDEMLEYLNRDYLLERAEAILSMRLRSVMYRRLSLGPSQRFASKGGYVARFASPDGSALVAETDWTVP